jgi:uncharacterized protein
MNTNKPTLVVGASPNPDRFSFKAVNLLKKFGHDVQAIGIKNGTIGEIAIQQGMPALKDINTVTLYIGRDKQQPFYDYILLLKPERVIFNPGTENPEFKKLLSENNIHVYEDCTLVMLNSGRF